jgi:hypothetical protein
MKPWNRLDRLTDRRFVGSSITALGAGQLAGSYFASSWLSGVLVNSGTATLLFVPLFLVQQRMERRVERAQESVAELGRTVENTRAEFQQSLDELRQSFAATDQTLRDETAQTIASVEATPSCSGVRKALSDAIRDRVVSERWGLRVRVVDPDLSIYARLQPTDGDSVTVTIEKRDGESVAELVWTPDRPAEDVMVDVAKELRAASLLGVEFDPGLMFQQLKEALATARAVKERFAVLEDMATAQEYVAPQWMVYDWGLGAWHDESIQPYDITLDRIRDDDIIRHMLEKPWVHENSFRAALTTAQLLVRAGRLTDDE